VAAKIWGLEEKHRGGNHSVNNAKLCAKSLGKQLNVGDKSIIQARDLLRDAQDLAREVEQGAPLSTKYNTFLERQRKLADERRMAERAKEYEDQMVVDGVNPRPVASVNPPGIHQMVIDGVNPQLYHRLRDGLLLGREVSLRNLAGRCRMMTARMIPECDGPHKTCSFTKTSATIGAMLFS
jgi:hypothetical protein